MKDAMTDHKAHVRCLQGFAAAYDAESANGRAFRAAIAALTAPPLCARGVGERVAEAQDAAIKRVAAELEAALKYLALDKDAPRGSRIAAIRQLAALAATPAPAVEREVVGEVEACIASGGKQKDVAPLYALAIRQLDPRSPVWSRINDAVTARWPKGLDRVKKLAWEAL